MVTTTPIMENKSDSCQEDKNLNKNENNSLSSTSDTTKQEKKDSKLAENEMSEEDIALKEGLELSVARLQDPDESLHEPALEYLVKEIRLSTSSMTAVPKPLKFLLPHYESLKIVYENMAHGILKVKMADVLSVLAMTMSVPGSRECLRYKLLGTTVDIASWGHEYARFLSGEISEEYTVRFVNSASEEESPYVDDLLGLVYDIIPFQMKHNAESEAVDLLIEVKNLDFLLNGPSDMIDDRNFERVCLYMIRCADYIADPDDISALLETSFSIYKNQGKYCDALRIALKMVDSSKVKELFSLEESKPMQRQMAFILGNHRSSLSFDEADTEVNSTIGNVNLSDIFIRVAKDMGLSEPKSATDIFKSTSNSRHSAPSSGLDSSRGNLATTFVNAFVNCGHSSETLFGDSNDGTWVFRNRDLGKLSAVASLGLVYLWNLDGIFGPIDKFFHIQEDYIVGGACLAVGVASSGVRSESDSCFAVLSEYIENKHDLVRISAILGLGIAYCGSQKEEIREILIPIIANSESKFVEVCFSALALGMVYVGSCEGDIASELIQRLMESSSVDLKHHMSKFFCLGLGLLFLNKCEEADISLMAVSCLEHDIKHFASIALQACAYCGSGNVLKVQSFLRTCAEHLTENAEHQAMAVLGIAMIVLGEEMGSQMSLRTFEHLSQYGELPVRRVIPLAIALLHLSNPDFNIIDQLSRLSHDQDEIISVNAIFAIGLVSCGTNNSRVAGLLRQLAEYYTKDANHLLIVRIAQGLNAMSKGITGLNPFHSDRFVSFSFSMVIYLFIFVIISLFARRLLLNNSSMAGILTVLVACLDIKLTLLENYHYLLFSLATAINPRFLVTLSPELELVPVAVRVGQAVETVGQAGRPKTISGFQV